MEVTREMLKSPGLRMLKWNEIAGQWMKEQGALSTAQQKDLLLYLEGEAFQVLELEADLKRSEEFLNRRYNPAPTEGDNVIAFPGRTKAPP